MQPDSRLELTTRPLSGVTVSPRLRVGRAAVELHDARGDLEKNVVAVRVCGVPCCRSSAAKAGIPVKSAESVMKLLLHALAATAIGAAIGPSLSAQWPPYPTAGVPRTPGGQPNL